MSSFQPAQPSYPHGGVSRFSSHCMLSHPFSPKLIYFLRNPNSVCYNFSLVRLYAVFHFLLPYLLPTIRHLEPEGILGVLYHLWHYSRSILFKLNTLRSGLFPLLRLSPKTMYLSLSPVIDRNTGGPSEVSVCDPGTGLPVPRRFQVSTCQVRQSLVPPPQTEAKRTYPPMCNDRWRGKSMLTRTRFELARFPIGDRINLKPTP